jgi:hypothetical protein
MKKISCIFLLALSANAYANVIVTSFSSPPDGCKTDHHCDLRGYHTISILNESQLVQSYNYQYKLCLLRDSNETNCYYVPGQVYIKPHETWINAHQNMSQPRISWAGTYNYHVVTSVEGISMQWKADNRYRVKVS